MLEKSAAVWYNCMGSDFLKIIDKAVWQTDGGVPADKTVQHFDTVFCWLSRHGFLTEDGEEELEDGEEELEDGIDDCASLNSELVNEQGMAFLESCYDEYLEAVKDIYGEDTGGGMLERIWQKYTQTT